MDINNVQPTLRLDLKNADGFQLRGGVLATGCCVRVMGTLDADPMRSEWGAFPREHHPGLLLHARLFPPLPLTRAGLGVPRGAQKEGRPSASSCQHAA